MKGLEKPWENNLAKCGRYLCNANPQEITSHSAYYAPPLKCKLNLLLGEEDGL